MTLHPEDLRYWEGWAIAFVLWALCKDINFLALILRAMRALR